MTASIRFVKLKCIKKSLKVGSSNQGVQHINKTWTYCAFRGTLARFQCSLLAFSPSGASINLLSDHHCSPALTSSTHWPGAEPVSGQGPDPWTLAVASGPMGWSRRSCDPSSQGYLLLWHNAIGHSHQNDGAQGIFHADHSNGCWPLRPTLAAAPTECRKMALLILCHRCLFVFADSHPYCVSKCLRWYFSRGRVRKAFLKALFENKLSDWWWM